MYSGKTNVKLVPLPTSVLNEILPLKERTALFTIAKPSPVPEDLVVK